MTGLFCRAFWAVFLFSRPGIFNYFIRWRPVLKKKHIGFPGKSEKIPVTLYTRDKKKRRPVFLFIAGTKFFIQKSRQLNCLAKALAVIGYHVIIMDDAANTGIKLSGAKTDILNELVGAVCQDELFDKERIVVAGLDFSSRFVFAFMNDSKMVDKIRCFLFLSPVADIPALVKFAYTGRVKFGNRCFHRKSSANLRLLYLYFMIESFIKTKKSEEISLLFEKLLENRTTEAFKIAQNLDPETRRLILSIFRGEMTEEDIRDIINIDKRDLEKLFLPLVPETDIECPIFIIQSILDEDIDFGQSHRLINALNSSAGVYLHPTDFITPNGNRTFFSNPARWALGAFRLTNALYRIFTHVYSDKNKSYNPTKSAIRIID